MDTIREIGTSICITMVAVGLFTMLIPNNNLTKTIKFTVSLFFICCIVVPIVNTNFDFDSLAAGVTTDQPAEIPFEEQVNQHLIRMTEENISENIRLELQKENIPAENIATTVHIEEDGSIVINNVTLTVDSGKEEYTEGFVRELLESSSAEVIVNTREE